MLRLAKYLAIALGAVALLAAAATALLVRAFDPNDYTGYAAEAFQSRTGRSLQIEHTLELELFPWLAIRTGGLVIGNADGFGERPFATVRRAEARVKLLPLLRRELEIGTIALEGAVLHLTRDGAGRGNWEDLIALARESAPSDPAGGESSAPAAGRLGIEAVEIRDGSILWRENLDEMRYVVDGIELATGAIAASRPVDLRAAFSLHDVRAQRRLDVSSRARLHLTGPAAPAVRGLDAELSLRDEARTAAQPLLEGRLGVGAAALEEGAVALEDVRFTGAGAEARADLRIEGLPEAPRAAGRVQARAESLDAVLDRLGIDLPDGVEPGSLGPAEASADFAATLDPLHVEIESLEATLVGVEMGGIARLDGDRLAGRLEVPRFAPGRRLRDLARAALPASIDVDAVGEIALDAAIEAVDGGGTIRLDDVRAQLLGASWSGAIDMSRNDGGALYSGTIRSSRFAPEEFAAVFADLITDTVQPGEMGMLALDTRFRYDARGASARFEPLAVEAFGLEAAGYLDAASLASEPVYTGRARVAEFDPRELFRRFGRAPPETSDDTVLRSAAIDTRFRVAADRGRFHELELRLDASRIGGEFTVESFIDPAYRFALSADRIDVDRYLPPRAQDADAGERAAGDIELSPEPLRNLEFAGSAEVGELALAGMSFRSVSTRIEIGGGVARLDPARAALYGGEFEGRLIADATGDEPTMRLDGRATDIALEPLILDLRSDSRLSGTGSFDLALSGRGASITQNLRSAEGEMRFQMRDGAIHGFNVGRALCAAYNLTQRLPAPPDDAPRQTRYELIGGTAQVAAGIATSRDLLVRAAYMDVTGRGTLELAERHLDYELDATLTDSIEMPNCASMDRLIGASIPFTLRGNVDSPEIRPAFGELVRRRVEEALRDRATENLRERLRERLRDLL